MSHSGAGKTPASSLSLGQLVDIEIEDKKEFDEKRAERFRNSKRKRSLNSLDTPDKKEENSDIECETQGLAEEARMFHCKTRVVESITPEALTLTLFYGSSNIVVKWDEFKVFTFICN